MRLLVTGGTGFIGSHLAEQGRRRGAEVVVLGLTDRPEERANAELLRAAGRRGGAGQHHRRRAVPPGGARRHPRLPPRRGDAGRRQERRVLRVGQPRRHPPAARGGGERAASSASSTAARSGSTATGRRASPGRTRRSRRATSTSAPRSRPSGWCGSSGPSARLPFTILRPADVYGPRDQRLLKLFKGVSAGRFPLFGDGRRPAAHGLRGRRRLRLLPRLRARPRRSARA